MRAPPPPFFFIYGQPVREIAPNFIHVERISDRQTLHEGLVPAHSHPHLHQLSLWTRAEGKYRLGTSEVPLSGQALTWMPSGVVHGFEVSRASDAIVVSMSHDFLNGLFDDLALNQVQALRHRPIIQPLSPDVSDLLVQTFEEIEREYIFPSWAQSRAVVAHMRIAVITLARLVEHIEDPIPRHRMGSTLYARLLAAIDQHFKEHLALQDYARILATTPYLLNRASQEAAGVRASQVIRNRLVQEAKRLLVFTMLDAASVGFALGFEDPAHFGRFFRQATGITPAAWRAQNSATAANVTTCSPP